MPHSVHVRLLALSISLWITTPAWGCGITPEDYMNFEFVGAPALSPDSRQVASGLQLGKDFQVLQVADAFKSWKAVREALEAQKFLVLLLDPKQRGSRA